MRSFGILGCLGAFLLVVGVSGASAQTAAQVTNDRAAAIVVFPRVEVDTANGVDTILEISNTDPENPVGLHCFYVNALGTCSQSGDPCLFDFECEGVLEGETCVENWTTTDFRIIATLNQPLGWVASEGLQFLPCDPANQPPQPPEGCPQENSDIGGAGGSSIPPTDDPFFGELKCVRVSETDQPVAENDLIGRATIHRAVDSTLDVATYNAIGIESTGTNDGDNVLCLGANASGDCTTAEYASCPRTLIVNHFYDGATVAGDTVRTELTLVPCTEFQEPRPGQTSPDTVRTRVQILTFNEFEQRLSAIEQVECYRNLRLADIDTRPGFEGDDSTSIFWVGTQGTIGGQTRLRAISDDHTDHGHGILAIATEFRSGTSVQSASTNVYYENATTQADIIRLQLGP
ncbi:MAG: hypothetical protein KatS3mg076_0142 [Candidatus Binatia bacterium]|nr:MAG: hypothetical protein KatS3mg076_0142 [Candidatus Binatia bacterium]